MARIGKVGGTRCPADGVNERYTLRHRMHYLSSEVVTTVVEQRDKIIAQDLRATAFQGEHLFHQAVNRVVQDLHQVPSSVIL